MTVGFRVAVSLLISIPIATMVYKTTVLKLSLIPAEVKDEWSVQVQLETKSMGDLTEFSFPVAETSPSQMINQLEFHHGNFDLEKQSSADGQIAIWKGNLSSARGTIGYDFRARITAQNTELPRKVTRWQVPRKLQPYLKRVSLSSYEAERINQLEAAIIDPDTNKLDALKRIFFYVSEEIRSSPSTTSIAEALDMGRGSAFVKAKIFNILARRAGIPARTTLGVRLGLDTDSRPARNRYRFSYLNEVHINSEWYAVDLTRRTMGMQTGEFLTFHHNIEQLDFDPTELQEVSVYAVPLRANRYNAEAYSDELRRSDSIFYSLSLYNLPLSAQAPLYIILLLPIGAVALSLFRNIIGVNTFGIFTPVLLTVFFMETPFIFAFSFFGLVVFLGFFQRILLDKLYLLAVPRVSIQLTFVIIAYVLFIVTNHNAVFGSSNMAILSYFPVVIITILIERFSIDFIEEGAANTFSKLVGTALIALFCYLIFKIELLRVFVFTHPEFLLATIGLNLLIGNYKGYRLSEFARFRDLATRIGS